MPLGDGGVVGGGSRRVWCWNLAFGVERRNFECSLAQWENRRCATKAVLAASAGLRNVGQQKPEKKAGDDCSSLPNHSFWPSVDFRFVPSPIKVLTYYLVSR